MFFPDVRLKKYIEIRPADSLPDQLAMGYAALIKSLFVKNALPDICAAENADIENAKNELIEKGYNGVVYGRPVRDIIGDMFKNALSVLSSAETGYLTPLIERVQAAEA